MATVTKSKNKSGTVFIALVRKSGISKKRTFDTKSEAMDWATDFEARIARSDPSAILKPSKTLFTDVVKKYKSNVLISKKGATREIVALDRIVEFFTNHTISSINKNEVVNYKNARLAKVQPGTVRREMDVLAAVLEFAKEELGLLFVNPARDVKKPAPAKARDRRLLKDEYEALEQAYGLRIRSSDGTLAAGCDNELHGLIFAFAVETAARQAEICGIKKADVREKNILLHDTKNGDDRETPLSIKARQVVKEAAKLSVGDYLFNVSTNAVRLAWRRAKARARKQHIADCKQAGIPATAGFLENLRFHDLRHEATSRLAEKLHNVIELSAVTGHRDLQSLKRYYHPRADDLADKLG